MVETWTRTRNATHVVHTWLRDVLTIGGAHYYQGRVRFVITAHEVTSPSLPVSLLLGGLPKDLEFALRGPADLSRPDAVAQVDVIERVMMPQKAPPRADEPLPPAPAWRHLGQPHGTALGVDEILAGQGLRRLPVTEADLLTRNAFLAGLSHDSLTGAHRHAQLTLTGGVPSGEPGQLRRRAGR